MRREVDHNAHRVLGAIPDMLTGGFFLVLWLSPLFFGPEGVKTAFLLLLVEFLLMHASGVLGSQQGRGTAGCLPLIGFGGLYLLIFLIVALSFDAGWPLLALAWLVVGKLTSGSMAGRDDLDRRHWNNAIWMLSFAAWIPLFLLVSVLPLPRLGMTPEAMALIEIGGSGAAADNPHKAAAFGLFYFSLLAWAKGTGFNVIDYFSRDSGRRK